MLQMRLYVASLLFLTASLASLVLLAEATESESDCDEGTEGPCYTKNKITLNCHAGSKNGETFRNLCKASKEGCFKNCTPIPPCFGPSNEDVQDAMSCKNLYTKLVQLFDCTPDTKFYDKEYCQVTNKTCCDTKILLLGDARGPYEVLGGEGEVNTKCAAQFLPVDLDGAYKEAVKVLKDSCCYGLTKCEPRGCPCTV